MTPFRLLWLPLAVLASSALPVSAQETILSDQMLPGKTYLHITLKNVEDAKKEFFASPSGQMINAPEMTDFRAELERAFGSNLQEALAQVEDQLGISVEELLQIPSGEVSLSISSAGNHVGLVIHVDYGDSDEQVQSLLELAGVALSQVEEIEMMTEDIADTEVTLYKVLDDVPTPLIKEFGWFTRDGHLVICSSRNVMEHLLTNWGGAEDNLAENETYSYMLNRLESEPGAAQSVLYFDLVGLAQELVSTASFGNAGFYAGMAIGQLPLLGFDQLKGFAVISEGASDEFQMIQRGMVYADQPPRGLMRMFMLEPVNAAPPDWVKEDAVMYTAFNWQVNEAYNAIEELVDGFQGTGTLTSLLDQFSESGPGVNIKEDLIDQLSGSVQIVGGPGTGGAPTGQMLFAVGIQDTDRFSNLLAKLSDEPQFPATMREFRGFTLYEIAEAGQSIGMTVAHGHLMVAMGETVLEQVLRNDSDVRPLAESEDYKRIAAHFPSQVVSVSFARPAEQYRTLYEMLQSGAAAEQFPGNDEIFEMIDFSTLPPFDVVSKYLSASGGYTVTDDNGLVTEGFSLKP